MKSLTVALLAVVVLGAELASAQPAADAKARGYFNFYGRGARSAMRGARDSAGAFREYIRSTRPGTPQIVREQPGPRADVIVRVQPEVIVVSPRIAQAATDEIGDYIAKSERHLAWMRRQAESLKDQATLAALDSIDRNLAAAKVNHATLCGCCMEDNVDAVAAMACCQKIDDALAKAISEHDALMKRLGEQQPAPN
ncbi:MAG: hypothetical protein ACKOCX_00625 [Planctomycetota bacterium]